MLFGTQSKVLKKFSSILFKKTLSFLFKQTKLIMQKNNKNKCDTNRVDKNKNISVFDNIYYISGYTFE